MRVIDIDQIKIASINGKYNGSRNGLYLSPVYREFKKELTLRCRLVKIKAPYEVTIEIATATDIDNTTKAILDALQARGVIDDDANVSRLVINKTKIKRGHLGAIKVDVCEAIPA
jgi:Holliday junction resolvase RusA-like endonuclease